MSLEAIVTTAAQSKVKTVVVSHLTTLPGLDDYTPWEDISENIFPERLSSSMISEF